MSGDGVDQRIAEMRSGGTVTVGTHGWVRPAVVASVVIGVLALAVVAVRVATVGRSGILTDPTAVLAFLVALPLTSFVPVWLLSKRSGASTLELDRSGFRQFHGSGASATLVNSVSWGQVAWFGARQEAGRDSYTIGYGMTPEASAVRTSLYGGGGYRPGGGREIVQELLPRTLKGYRKTLLPLLRAARDEFSRPDLPPVGFGGGPGHPRHLEPGPEPESPCGRRILGTPSPRPRQPT